MMKSAKVFAALASLCVVSPAFAGEGAFDNTGLNGSYHSVEAKSYWSNGEFPKGFSLTIDLAFGPDGLHYHSVNDTRKPQLYVTDFNATLDDVAGPLEHNPRFNEIRIRQLDADTFQVLEQKDGDVIVGQYWRFSKDRHMLTRWGVGKAPDGKSKAFLETFERVK